MGITIWDPNTGQRPLVGQMGQGGGFFGLSGNINQQISSAGISPGATAADNVLFAFAIPANSFDIAGRQITITAFGSFVNNVNAKRCKIIFNPASAVVGSTVGASGTTIADTGSFSTAANVGWQLVGQVTKYGLTGSNTQIGSQLEAQAGASVATLGVPSLITATESGLILVAVTGNAATTASDILGNGLTVSAND
jgi:hypothetical protein